MEFVLKDSIHTAICETLYNDILTQRSVYHYFIGGSYTDGQSVNLVAKDTYEYELATRNEILAFKKVTASDVAFVVDRIDWESGIVYDMYDDAYSDTNKSASGANAIHKAKFYVVTDQFNVYKCLFNNQGKASTIKPTGTSSSRFTTADNYVWKFMYTIPLSSRNKFMNSKFIPVQTAMLNPFYSEGKIEGVQITSAGSGYTTANISITGDGTGATATPVITSGQIVDVIINNPGTGYTYANMTVNGNGSGAVVLPVLSVGDLNSMQSNVELLAVNGEISSIVVTNGGSGYPSATVTISGDGTGAQATPVITNGVIVRIDITNPGLNYTRATVTINGSGTGASARAVMSPKGGHGRNAIYELFARRLQFYTSISAEKNQGFAILNDYTQIGLVRNVKAFDKTERFYSLNGSPLYAFDVSGTLPQKDDILSDVSTSKRYRVYATDTGKILVQNLDNIVPVINSTLLNTTRGGTLSITAITKPTVDKFSGDLLLIDNVSVVKQVPDQMITLKTAIKF